MTAKLSYVSAAALAALAFPFACGGDDGGPHVVTHDASMGSNMADAAGPAPCLAEATYTPTFGSDNAFADEVPQDANPDNPAHQLYFDGYLDNDPEGDDLYIDLVQGYGVFGGSGADITTGDVVLAGDEIAYSTCGACVYIAANITEDGPTDFYFAQSGVLSLTSISGNLTGTISNVTFARVGYDEDMGWAGDTPIGECTSHIDSASFDIPITVDEGSGGGSAAAVGKIHLKVRPQHVLRHRFR